MINQVQTRAVLGLAIVVVALVACGGGQPAPAAQPTADPSKVTPLTGSEAAGDMGVKNAAGVSPCGVFNVNGFGDKHAALADFPGCTAAAYEVMCLDGSAQWQATYISNVALSADKKEVTFSSQQEGSCALFPAQ